MHTAALLLIFFAVLVACWGFSVIVRSISEWRFFRKYPKSTARKAGRWWSPLVGLMAMAASVYPCKLGLRWAEMDSGIVIGWLYAVAAGVGVFGLWIGIFWAIGDRSRGRRRCTRCLYDMSELPGLRCPECGREFRSEKHLFRAKRGRWACVVSLFLVSASGFMFSRAVKVEEHGPLMLVPTPLLMAGWRWLPAPTIYSWDHDAFDGSLEQRLEYIDDLDWPARIRIADRLLTRMQRSEEIRWNRRLTSLINACLGPNSGVLEDPGLLEAAAGLGTKHGHLLDALGIDILLAAADPHKRSNYETLSQSPVVLNHAMRNPYFMLRYLVALDTLQRDDWLPGEPWPDLHRLIPDRRELMPLSRALGNESAFLFDRFRDGLLLDVAVDSGFAGRHAMLFFPDRADQLDWAESIDRITKLSIILATHDDVGPDATKRLRAWAESNNSSEAGFALDVTGWWCSHSRSAHQPTDELADQLFAAAIRSLGDGSILYSHPNGDYRVRQAAQFAIIRLDKDGSRSVPLVRDWLLNDGEFPRHPRYDRPDSDPDLIAAWAEHLSDLAWSDDVEFRRWLARALPIRTGTPADARIEVVIARLLADEDEDVRWEVEYAAAQRREAVRNP